MKYIYVVMFLLLLTPAIAIDCLVDYDPFILSLTKPIASCSIEDTQNNTKCLTWLSNPDNSSEEWGVMPPKGFKVRGVGREGYFPVIDGVVTVSFSTERMFHNRSVTGNIWCGSEQYAFNMTPQYADFEEPTELAITLKENSAYAVLAAIFLIFIISLIAFMADFVKGQ